MTDFETSLRKVKLELGHPKSLFKGDTENKRQHVSCLWDIKKHLLLQQKTWWSATLTNSDAQVGKKKL